MSETRVVHVKDNVPGAAYVGRANHRAQVSEAVFHNPFRIGPDCTREQAIRAFEFHVNTPKMRRHWWMLPDLRGKPLACWCRHDGELRTPENACHADVIVDLLDKYTDEQLRQLAALAGEG